MDHRPDAGVSSRRRPGVLAPAMLLLPFVGALTFASAADPPLRIVVLGDSLTSGRGIGRTSAYPALLQERLAADGYDYRVVNEGVSGDTTSRALRRVDNALGDDVQILVVALGANDGLRGVSVDQLKANLGRIIEEGQRRHADVVLVGMDALPIHGLPYSIAFHRAYEELAAKYRIPLVPSVLPTVMLNASLMQRDRVHPNEAGARTIADAIWPFLKPLLKRAA